MSSFRLFWIFAAVMLPASGQASGLDPATIHRGVATTNARSVVGKLSDKQYEWILGRAESGDARWIAVLIELAPGADGWRGEAVDISLSRALTTNPSEVLRVIKKGYGSIGAICGDNEIEPSPQSVNRFIQTTVSALAAVRDPSLYRLRDACIANIRRR